MQFQGFTLDPAYDVTADDAVIRRVGETFEREALLSKLPAYTMLRVELRQPAPAGCSVAQAHGNWLADILAKMETPPHFPRQPDDAICPDGLVAVTIDCMIRTIGGHSYYGYEGYFLGLLLSLPEGRIWDVRGEPTP